MGKNRRSKFSVFDSIHNKTLSVDSQEEVEFTKWLCRAIELGIIQDFTYQPKSFKLSDKVEYTTIKGKIKTLFREHIYTADFIIFFDRTKFTDLAEEFKCYSNFDSNIKMGKYAYYVDVKGGFQQDAGRSFSMNQKWLFERFHVYVHKVVPKKFFAKFGIPEELRFTEKTRKPSKKYAGYLTIAEKFTEGKTTNA